MRTRARALLFAAGALACAGLSAALASSASEPASEGLGELREVVVVSTPLERGASLRREAARGRITERRVPEVFAPPDAVSSVAEVEGGTLALDLPAGSYVTRSALKADRRVGPARRASGTPRGTTPVEITVVGAGALSASRTGIGERVDVIVSGDAAPGPRAGRTYVAARSVVLLALREAEAETGAEADRWVATLALGRSEALRLIRAEGVAAQVRLLAS